MLPDALGRPLRFVITAGQAGDKAYDSSAFRERIDDLGAKAVIPSYRTRRIASPRSRRLQA